MAVLQPVAAAAARGPGEDDAADHVDGVLETEVGYCGGENENATYRNHPGHAEAVRVVFDPNVISLRKLLVDTAAKFRPQSVDTRRLRREGRRKGLEWQTEVPVPKKR